VAVLLRIASVLLAIAKPLLRIASVLLALAKPLLAITTSLLRIAKALLAIAAVLDAKSTIGHIALEFAV